LRLDCRLTNGNIVTMDPARPAARELGVWRGRIVGLDEAVSALPADRVIDLDGATVLPGFIDPHVHLAWTGFEAGNASIAGRGTPAEALEVIAEAVAGSPPGEWVDVVGYDQRPLGRHLTAAELDAISLGRRVFVFHQSGHACVVNTPVLELLPGVPHESGLLAESGMAAARAVRRPYSVGSLCTAIERAGRTCLSEGITAVAEAGIAGGMVGNSAVEAVAYQRLCEAGRLPVRVALMVAADVLHPVAAHLSDDLVRGLDLGLRTGFGGDRLSLGALKIFTDGGMMARTAALTQPYNGLGHTGELFADPEVIAAQVLDGHRAGWQLAIHAIGDRAIDVALDALEAAHRVHPRSDARHRIEHAGLVRPDQLPRLAGAAVTVVVQPNFLWYLGDDYAAIMGAERTEWLYRARAFLDHGIPLSASSDRPVTPGAPLRAIQFLVERQTSAGQLIGPAERIGIDEALHAYTVGAAFACRRENDLGTLTSGKHADFVVLSDDPRRVDVSRIADIGIVATVVAGDVAYGSLS
jgi:predicted amidohydrolase YtcJ